MAQTVQQQNHAQHNKKLCPTFMLNALCHMPKGAVLLYCFQNDGDTRKGKTQPLPG